jgi:rhamnosyltransferase
MAEVTVAIPVRDGGEPFAGVLEALAGQTVAHELLVCDSGSRDGSVELARAHGARVLEIAPQSFNHGATRNLLMDQARGVHVALLTQDAQPAGQDWLERLLAAFELGEDVAIAYGPYRARDHASAPVRIELERWFSSLSPDGSPQLERLTEAERSLPAGALVGRRGFFSDANSCIARQAWERVPFRQIAYAEDRALALDMMRAGYAKAYVPQAAVIHSHEYTPTQYLRRCFDEWRALLEVYGWREPADPRHLLNAVRGDLSGSRERLLADGVPAGARRRILARVAVRQGLRLAGALLGSHADRLPPSLRKSLSLERRAELEPLRLKP